MLGIGFFEIVIIAVVCFIAIGPKQLPAVMRKLAQFYREFAGLRDELRFQIMSADDGSATHDRKPPAAASPPPVQNTDEIVVVPRKDNHG